MNEMAILPSPTPDATRFTEPRAGVSRDENAGDAGFEEERVAVEFPFRGPFPVAFQVRASENEAFGIAYYGAVKPFGVGFGADENEDAGRRNGFRFQFRWICRKW